MRYPRSNKDVPILTASTSLKASPLRPIRSLTPIPCKEFLNASRWYFVGPPPAFGGGRPRAEAAASPAGWPPPQPHKIPPTPIQKLGIRERMGCRGGLKRGAGGEDEYIFV